LERAPSPRRTALIFEKACSMGVQSGEYGGRKSSSQPRAAMAWRMLSAWWALRWSTTTTCPGRSVGASCAAIDHANVAVSIAPAIIQGSCRPSGASAAPNVVCLPWWRGTDPVARWSCGAQPDKRVRELFVPLSSTKTSCCGSSWAAAARQAVRPSSLRTARLPVSFVLRPAQAADGPPPRRLAQLLALVLRPPGAVFQHCGVRCRFQPRPQARLLLWPATARAAGNGLARQRARLALLPHGAVDRGHGDVKAASGFSHGQTVSHRSHQSFFQVGRIRTHTWGHSITLACHCFSQVALRSVALSAEMTMTCASGVKPTI